MGEQTEGKPMRARGKGPVFQDNYRNKATRESRTCETWTIRRYHAGKHQEQGGGFPTKRLPRFSLPDWTRVAEQVDNDQECSF